MQGHFTVIIGLTVRKVPVVKKLAKTDVSSVVAERRCRMHQFGWQVVGVPCRRCSDRKGTVTKS